MYCFASLNVTAGKQKQINRVLILKLHRMVYMAQPRSFQLTAAALTHRSLIPCEHARHAHGALVFCIFAASQWQQIRRAASSAIPLQAPTGVPSINCPRVAVSAVCSRRYRRANSVRVQIAARAPFPRRPASATQPARSAHK